MPADPWAEWLAQALAWLSDPSLQNWAIPFAFGCYFIVFHYWRGLSPIVEVDDRLGEVVGHSTSGFARRLLGHIRRLMRQASTVGGIVLACMGGLLLRLTIGAALALVVLFITGIALQPHLGPLTGDPAERVVITVRLLGGGLLDALTFDLFSIWGIELRPTFESVQARILIFAFYAIEAVLIGETLLTLGMNLWTALVCLMLPQPALRLARTGRAETLPQWFVQTFTTIGST